MTSNTFKIYHYGEAAALGFGVEYLFDRKIVSDSGDFYFLPVYAFAKINLSSSYNKSIAPYLFVQVGYNIYGTDENFMKTILYKPELEN